MKIANFILHYQNFFYDSYKEYYWNSDILGDGNIRNQCTKYILPASQKDQVLKNLKNIFITEPMLMKNNDPLIKKEEELIKKLKCEFLEKYNQ